MIGLFPALAAVPQEMIGQHNRHHGLADGHGADANTWVVTAFGGDFGFVAQAVDGFARG